MKEFNTTAVCIPSKHYMVDLSERVDEIKKLVDAGKYFTINRARQYGKTTTLNALENDLSNEYDVISIDFQDMTDSDFLSESDFSKGLSKVLCDAKDNTDIPISDKYYNEFQQLAEIDKDIKLRDIFQIFDRWCKDNNKPIVLIIDEVDTATNNQVFLDFLGKLRSNYLKKEKNPHYNTFQSVILAGVTDVKHIKSKIRDDIQHKLNSPWNIAADFKIDMSLSAAGIRGMLEEYKTDHNIVMDTGELADYIREYTNGYPFLVSRICQLIDEDVSKEIGQSSAWTRRGIDEAVKKLLAEDNTLFQSITEKLTNYPELKESLRSILIEGTRLTYNAQQDSINQMQMYGLINNYHNTVAISNRIFETMLYNLFLSDEEMKSNTFSRESEYMKNKFVKDGKLDMRMILEQFIITYIQVFGALEEKFKEKDGRELFLLYLKPIINGTGNYYIEAQTRNQTRTDIVVDYLGQQYIIELKIWRGDRYNADGEKHISDYLDYFNLDVGYMLSFNFNKNKESGVKRVNVGDKVLFEGMV